MQKTSQEEPIRVPQRGTDPNPSAPLTLSRKTRHPKNSFAMLLLLRQRLPRKIVQRPRQQREHQHRDPVVVQKTHVQLQDVLPERLPPASAPRPAVRQCRPLQSGRSHTATRADLASSVTSPAFSAARSTIHRIMPPTKIASVVAIDKYDPPRTSATESPSTPPPPPETRPAAPAPMAASAAEFR